VRELIQVLKNRDYRLLWSGSVVSLIGDGATWTALAWLAITIGDAGSVAIMAVCYTMPIILGGTVIGPLMDRISRRFLLVADSLFRAVVIGAVPVIAFFGDVELWHLYVTAVAFGLLKIVPLAVVPTLVPELVEKRALHSATALESIAYGAAGMAGPAIGGVLIAVFDAPTVLLLDALTYLVFAACIMAIKAPLAAPEGNTSMSIRQSFGWKPVFALFRNDRVLVAITVSFALFNATVGMIRVVIPWIVVEQLDAGAGTLGVVLAIANSGALVGAFLSGVVKPTDRQMLRVGVLQLIGGLGLLFLFGPQVWMILLGLMILEFVSTPMTVSAQVLRLARIPADIRGRTMTFMRTLLQATSPSGSALAGPMLLAGFFAPLLLIAVLATAVPAAVIAVKYRNASYADELGLNDPEPEPEERKDEKAAAAS
jgi:MFS family permease